MTQKKAVCSDIARLYAFIINYLGISCYLQPVYNITDSNLITTKNSHQNVVVVYPENDKQEEVLKTIIVEPTRFLTKNNYNLSQPQSNFYSDNLENLEEPDSNKNITLLDYLQKLQKQENIPNLEENTKDISTKQNLKANENNLFLQKWRHYLQLQQNSSFYLKINQKTSLNIPNKTSYLLKFLDHLINYTKYSGQTENYQYTQLQGLAEFDYQNLKTDKNIEQNYTNLSTFPGEIHILNTLKQIYNQDYSLLYLISPDFLIFSISQKLAIISTFIDKKDETEKLKTAKIYLQIINELARFFEDLRNI